MSITEILLPIGLVTLGIILFIYPEQAGSKFCKLGKTIWKISTLGITDMHWFYRENEASRVMRQGGIVLCVIAVVIVTFSIVSLSGPNSFAAMRQAEVYLQKTYGDSREGYSFICTAIPNEANGEIVHYEYSGKTGNLHASWNGKEYTFVQVP